MKETLAYELRELDSSIPIHNCIRWLSINLNASVDVIAPKYSCDKAFSIKGLTSLQMGGTSSGLTIVKCLWVVIVLRSSVESW